MAKLWAVLRREYMERVRSRWFLVATIFGPVLLGILLILPPLLALRTKPSEEATNIVILDATPSGAGARMAAAMPRTPSAPVPQVRVVPPMSLTAAESAATRAVVRGEVRGYLVIDAATLAGDSARYAGRNASSIGDMEMLRNVLRRAVMQTRLAEAHVDSATAVALADVRPTLATERLSEKGRGGSGMLSAAFGLGIAMLLYMSIILYGQSVLRGVLEEKNTRVAEVVVASVPPDTLLAGKVLGVGAVGITQQVAWLATGYLMFRVRVPILQAFGARAEPLPLPPVSVPILVVLVLFFVLGYLIYSSLFAAVGAMVNNDQDAQQAAMPVILLLVTPMLFLQTILLDPSSRTAQVLSWLPFSAPIIMPLRMVVASVPWPEVWLTIAGVLAGCVAATWLAARIYRVGLLMYGKKPSLRELARWVRASR
ncbi:MAG TPA: ABC transporter permease [Gemmatimonadaceae bacterium]|nr:ABC transporter permease [Gemmatimonadaceae bacterium]